MTPPAWRILIADDNAMFCGATEMLLKSDGHDVVTAETPAGARALLRSGAVDLAVLDLSLVREDPHDVSGLIIALEEAPEVPKIVITGHGDMELKRYFRVLNERKIPKERQPKLVFKPEEEDKDPDLLELRTGVHELLVPPVFVVHGHDWELRDEVVDRLLRLDLKPCVLDVQPGQGILQQFRKEAARAHYAIVILTGDDVGARETELRPLLESRDGGALESVARTLKPRARQNVTFELGYFAGLLGPERVLVLYDERVERPSDYEGIGYVPLDDRNHWKDRIQDALRKAGVERKPYQSR